MSATPQQLISEYSRMLSQLLGDVMEQSYLLHKAPHQLTRTQFSILKILNTSGSFLGSELSRILGISRPAVSKNVDKLVKHKLVTRKILKKDRRTTEISLLKSGRNFVQAYEKIRLQKQEKALEVLSDREKELLAELLSKYVRSCMFGEDMLDVICLQCNDVIMEDCRLINQENKCRFVEKIEKQRAINQNRK